jgi:hypothetical protein
MKFSKILNRNTEDVKSLVEDNSTVNINNIRPVSDKFCVLLSEFSFLVYTRRFFT